MVKVHCILINSILRHFLTEKEKKKPFFYFGGRIRRSRQTVHVVICVLTAHSLVCAHRYVVCV